MSRIGKLPVNVPKEVKITISGSSISFNGPKGKNYLAIPAGVKVEMEGENLIVNRLDDSKQSRSNHGTVRSLLKNMVLGVSKGHRKELEIQGVGLRANLQGKKVGFNLGFSHPVEFAIPEGVTVSVPTQTSIIIEGADKSAVGQVAATIRGYKPPEPYKGKGIRYSGEIVRRKQGKAVTK